MVFMVHAHANACTVHLCHIVTVFIPLSVFILRHFIGIEETSMSVVHLHIDVL
mgnify:CR=1 FL=1